MKFLSALFLTFVLTVPALPAEKAKTRWFADGLKVEAKLETGDRGTQFSVSRYDDTMDSDYLLFGDLTSEGDGVYRYEQKWTDDKEKEHVRTGKVTVKDGALSYSELKETGPDKPLESGGPWQEISAATALKNAKTRYEIADKRLNEAWKKANDEAGAAGRKALQESQKFWIGHRDTMAERGAGDALPAEESGSDKVDLKSIPEYWHHLTMRTVDRTPVLLAWSGKNVAPGKAGTYTDSFGGTVVISETKDGLDFEIDVVRGRSLAVGNIGGTAKLNGDTAAWTETPEDKEAKPAMVRLKFNPDKSLTVETENAESYGGHRAYFAGQYFKTTPASAGKKEK